MYVFSEYKLSYVAHVTASAVLNTLYFRNLAFAFMEEAMKAAFENCIEYVE